tara:strand:- start:1639 stop:6498 length:4860 start_codon:yes stop_codon:yes gene_type:complete
MAIDKIIPRYLNKEDDARLVKNIEMTDALNVRISADQDGDGGIVKNAYGNAAVSFAAGNNWQAKTHALPTGDNKVVGSVADLQDGIVIFFVWNSTQKHSIYRFTTAVGKSELVYRDSVLSFQKDTLVQADLIRNLDTDTLLYFTDGLTSPKKLNVSRAIRGGYSSVLNSGSDAEKLEFITLAKKPPLDPPTFEFITDSSLKENNVFENTYQFAYRYIYLDGEVSAISKYTELAVSEQQLKDGLITDAEKLKNNTIRVSVETSVADVKRIEVLAREGNKGPLFVIDEIKNPSLSTSSTLFTDFKNNQLYNFTPSTDSDKLYDAVPLSAQSQTISGSRLFLGNYVEGYANQDNDIALLPNYYLRPGVQTITVDNGTNPNGNIKTLTFDLSSITFPIPKDSLLNIDFSFVLDRLQIGTSNNQNDAFIHWVELDDDLLQANAGALLKDTITVDTAPIGVTESVNVPAGTTIQGLESIIDLAISKVYQVVFDCKNNNSNYAAGTVPNSATLGAIPIGGARTKFGGGGLLANTVGIAIRRFFTFNGLGSVELTSAGLNGNILTFKANVLSSTLNVKNIYKPTAGGGGEDFNNPVNFASSTPITVGDNITYQGYNAVGYQTTSDDIVPILPKSSPSVWESTSFDSEVVESSTFVTGDTKGYKGFKSGSTHSLGVVFYDDRNRSSAVQEAGNVTIDWYGNRQNKGFANVVMRIKSKAPSWAKRWSPVYGGGTIDQKLEYSVIRGYFASNILALKANAISQNNDIFYLSFRSLESKNDSYKESKGANIEYSFTEGDKLRVVSHGGSTFPADIIFDVVGYEDFTDDPATNPILDLTSDNSTYNTTGSFLVLKDKSQIGWDKDSIIAGTDNWDDKAIIELYKVRKKAEDEVYYEVGKSYSVGANGSMIGDRTSIPQYAVLCVSNPVTPLEFRSDNIMYPGDVMKDSSGNEFVVANAIPFVSGIYNYYIQAVPQFGFFTQGQTFTVNLQNSSETVINIDQGDIYFRLRQLRYGKNAKSFNFLIRYVESKAVSDFFTSKNTSIGRPFSVLPDAKQVHRTGSVTYSDAFLIDISTLGLSSFNPTLAPFYDLNYIHGSVRYMVNRDDSVVFIQDKKCGIFPVSRNLVEYSSGEKNLTVSTNVVGSPSYYQGEYGVNNNPESVAVNEGRIYFADIRNGAVIRISRDGITAISDAKMDTFFWTKFENLVQNASVKKVIGGFDVENNEYIISTESLDKATVTVSQVGGTSYAFDLQTNGAGNTVFGSIVYDDNQIFKADTEFRAFDNVCDNFDDSINAVIYLDRLVDGQPIVLGEEYIGTTPTALYGIATDISYNFFIPVLINVSKGTFTFPNDCGNFTAAFGTASNDASGFTAGYDAGSNVWTTLYSFSPDNIISIDSLLYTFKEKEINEGGSPVKYIMWKHSADADRNTYYGTAYNSVVEIISAANASMIKTFESISLEGTNAWTTLITNTDQSANILEATYDKRERNWYASIPRDDSANTGGATITALSGSSEVFALGAVSNVTGTDITFSSDISYITFPMGAALYKISGTTLVSISNTISSVPTGTKITCASTVSGLANGNEVVAIATGSVEGDQIRDYYSRIKLTNSSTSEIELYAVNTVYAKSNLANQLGQ